jgi:hypothetical protein
MHTSERARQSVHGPTLDHSSTDSGVVWWRGVPRRLLCVRDLQDDARYVAILNDVLYQATDCSPRKDKEQIRRRDRMAFQLFSQSPQYKKQVLLPRVKGILERVEACAKELPDLFFPDFMSDYSVEQALSLERTLLISRDDYRVYYPRPGVAFDPAWMKAEDHRGEVKDPLSCSGTKVSICMYPALVQTPSRELAADADITEALTQTKSFLPPPGKAARPSPDDTVISKAYVMVD